MVVFTNLEVPWTLLFRGFMEVSLFRHNWLNHWPLAIDSSFCPSHPRRFQVLYFLASSSHPEAIEKPTKGHFNSCGWTGFVLNIKRCSYHTGNSKGFRSYVPRTRQRPNIFFLLHHTIPAVYQKNNITTKWSLFYESKVSFLLKNCYILPFNTLKLGKKSYQLTEKSFDKTQQPFMI